MDKLIYKINTLGLTESDIKEIISLKDIKLLDVILEYYGPKFFHHIRNLIMNDMNLDQYCWMLENKIITFTSEYELDQRLDKYVKNSIKIKVFIRIILNDNLNLFQKYFNDLSNNEKKFVLNFTFMFNKPNLVKFLSNLSRPDIARIKLGITLHSLNIKNFNPELIKKYKLMTTICGNWKVLNHLLETSPTDREFLTQLIDIKKKMPQCIFDHLVPDYYSSEKTISVLSNFVSP